MAWIAVRLGNGRYALGDLDNPQNAPQVSISGEIQTTPGFSVNATTQKLDLLLSQPVEIAINSTRKKFSIYNRTGYTFVLMGDGNISEDLFTTRLCPNMILESEFRGRVVLLAENGNSVSLLTEYF
jgi:hypothetical protein